MFGVALAVSVVVACSEAPAPTQARSSAKQQASAVFAGGCFWCTEADFDKIPGVISTTSGYSGGTLANPTYKQASAGGTGHIESVRVVYDPTKVSYETLGRKFVHTIDPLDDGGSFCDRGHTYRSAYFVANPAQDKIARATLNQAAAQLGQPVKTLVLAAAPFYTAEEYHQNYYQKNPIRYAFYRSRCGRDARLKQLWKK